MIRALLGLTQTAAARRFKCSASLIALRETNKRQITVDQAVIMLAAGGYVMVVMHWTDAASIPRLNDPDRDPKLPPPAALQEVLHG